MLIGCAAREQVVLLTPDSTLTVTTERQTVLLSTAESGVEVTSSAHLKRRVFDGRLRQKLFGRALQAFPRPTVLYTLYFRTGTTELTSESEAVLAEVLEVMRTTSALEIEVTGHTDTQGPADTNDQLSLERAQVIKARIAAVPPPPRTLLRAIGRGERELLLPTPDDTDEGINRRVELRVR
jgi:outer membrane protein OmpA-like peptidoglycan-associated protein